MSTLGVTQGQRIYNESRSACLRESNTWMRSLHLNILREILCRRVGILVGSLRLHISHVVVGDSWGLWMELELIEMYHHLLLFFEVAPTSFMEHGLIGLYLIIFIVQARIILSLAMKIFHFLESSLDFQCSCLFFLPSFHLIKLLLFCLWGEDIARIAAFDYSMRIVNVLLLRCCSELFELFFSKSITYCCCSWTLWWALPIL